MIFRTKHPKIDFPFHIGYDDVLFFIGSCFSDHIGNFFSKHQFKAISNPFGTQFQPLSISQNLKLCLNLNKLEDKYIYYNSDHYISFLHQGKFNHNNKEKFCEMIQSMYQNSHQFLKETNYLFITFGTSYAYRFIEEDILVANCHKIPNYQFEKLRLNIDQIVQEYHNLLTQLFEFNSDIKVIFTVSPVRHLGEGFHENQISKSILHLSIDQLVDNKKTFYFPSYEILMDDLRDYRFYAQDLRHPGENGVSYIEEYIMQTFFTQETQDRFNLIEKRIKRENHITLK